MNVKVLHLIKGLGPGGAEHLLLNQARATGADEATFHVAWLVAWKDHLVAPLQAARWQTHLLGTGRGSALGWALWAAVAVTA